MAEEIGEERIARLQTLQMEDLGIARRDYLSTRDEGPKQVLSLSRLEASRASNQEGTECHRLAEENKDKLDAWKNAWKTLGQAEGDDLAPMMEGQWHRYNLMQTIKSNGGQKYEAETDTSVHPRGRRALGAPGGTGRGGGVIGARGRHQSISQRSSATVKERGKERSRGHDFTSGRPLDPSRDINNPQSPQRRGGKGRGNARLRPATMRPRVPVSAHPNENHGPMLADTASFMAAVSVLRTAHVSSRPTAVSEKGHNTPINDSSRREPTHSEAGNIEPCRNAESAEIAKSVGKIVQIEKAKITQEKDVQRLHETIAELSNAEPTPERPVWDIIEVFGSPSSTKETQTDSMKKKVDQGFSSTLPQPVARMRRQKQVLDDGHIDRDNTSMPSVNFNSPTIMNDGSKAPTGAQSSTAVKPCKDTGMEQERNASENVSLITEEKQTHYIEDDDAEREVEELRQTLSAGYLLPSIRKLLTDRKKELEDTLYFKETCPLPASMSTQPSGDETKQLDLAAVSAAPSTNGSTFVQSKVLRESQSEVAASRKIPMKGGQSRVKPADGNIQSHDTTQASNQLTLVNDEGNIIGNHLLPGRGNEPEPELPVEVLSKMREGKFQSRKGKDARSHARDVSTGSNASNIQRKTIHTRDNGNTSTSGKSSSQPLYGAQLKIRETAYLPQTAAAMQYAGQLSQNAAALANQNAQLQASSHITGQKTNSVVTETETSPIRGREGYRNRGHTRTDSLGSRVGRSHPSEAVRISSRATSPPCSLRGDAFKIPQHASLLSGSKVNDENHVPKNLAKKSTQGLEASRWAPKAPGKQGISDEGAQPGLEASMWAPRRDEKSDSRGEGLMASRWAPQG
ncbi:hypothetical protein DIZ76_017824 [Coccidioides immitis]|nr:hypothetical protein DIZ76_017824 [Coccidioides immitis]